MNFNEEAIFISHPLERHPVLEEDINYKMGYLNVLEHFMYKYSKKDDFAIEVLNNYKKVFLGPYIENYKIDIRDTRKITKNIIGTKFRGFKLFSYRYALLCDCLFINAMFDFDKAQDILNEIKLIYKKRYHKNLDLLFNVLYGKMQYSKELDKTRYLINCWKKNKSYIDKKQKTLLVTANMSAGKSTLINSIVGKTINRTMNDACTSKLHYIYNKSFEDGFNYEIDGHLNLDADEKALLNDDDTNKENKIVVSTHFNLLTKNKPKLCIIDTPGVNSSINVDHTDITKESILKEQYDKILYLINAENAGTDDDIKYLKFICESVDNEKIIFILNKLDRFKTSEDSIKDSIENLKKDLKNIGINNPTICPISSYAAKLAKKKLFGMELTEDEEDDYMLILKKFKNEEFNLSNFYSYDLLEEINKVYSNKEKDKNINLLIKCGMFCLEQLIEKGDENSERNIH